MNEHLLDLYSCASLKAMTTQVAYNDQHVFVFRVQKNNILISSYNNAWVLEQEPVNPGYPVALEKNVRQMSYMKM